MDRSFSIFFTSDIHGYFSDIDYVSGKRRAGGLSNCASSFRHDGNSLILDGGDTIQGSPFTYYYHKVPHDGPYLPAQVMNAAGVQFITLGNHDFNYGVSQIETYLSQLNATCLCANVEGIRGVEKTAVVTLDNGLRIGLTGVTSHYVKNWEPPENLEGVRVLNAFPAAEEAWKTLQDQNVDVTVCIYHGGFERDVRTDEILSETDENQGWRMCRELGFDLILTGHQHLKLENLEFSGTHTCQCPDKATGFIRVDAEVPDNRQEKSRFVSRFEPAGEERAPEVWSILAEEEAKAGEWLDRPVGHLDVPLQPLLHVIMAAKGSWIANFFNQVQLAASGADISVTCLGNTVKGFSREVSIRDVVSSYVFPNTLKTILVDRSVLKSALERCAEYFSIGEDRELTVSEAFQKPIVQHFNYDYFSGIETVIDIRNPAGQRVVSIRYQGKELEDGRQLKLCLNNYRATGAGGYPCYRGCPVIREQTEEISEMIMDYVSSHPLIRVDRKQWLKVIK